MICETGSCRFLKGLSGPMSQALSNRQSDGPCARSWELDDPAALRARVHLLEATALTFLDVTSVFL
jgi:hypothetical protein